VLADSDIQAIEDLEGKTIGGVAGSHKVDIMTQYIKKLQTHGCAYRRLAWFFYCYLFEQSFVPYSTPLLIFFKTIMFNFICLFNLSID